MATRILRLMTLCSLAASVGAQTPGVGTWKTYAGILNGRGAVWGDDALYVATSGGLVLHPLDGGEATIFTNTDGLSTIDLTAVGIDAQSRVWVGGSSGELNVYDPSKGAWEIVDDIFSSGRVQRTIRRFVPRGDTVFIVADFGVSVFRIDRWEFADTYSNFGYTSAPLVTDVVIHRDSLWVGTSAGLVVGDAANPNLSAPGSWTILPPSTFPASAVRSLYVLRDTLYAATSQGLVIKQPEGFVSHPSFASEDVVRLTVENGTLLTLVTQGGTSLIESLGSGLASPVPRAPVYPGSAVDVVVGPSGGSLELVLPTDGIARFNGTSWESRNPDAPPTSQFSNLCVDDRGRIWVGTGINSAGKGIMRFDPASEGLRWKSFTTSTHPALLSNDYYKVDPGADGSVWASSWGFGIVQIRGDSINRKLDATSTPPLSSTVSGDPSYVVVGGSRLDEAGNVWITNRTAVSGRPLVRLEESGQLTGYPVGVSGASGVFASIVIDRNGTAWIGNSEPIAKAFTGLFFFNEDLRVTGTASTGGWGVLTQSDGLPSNSVLSLCEDLEGDVWVGTDLGVSIITNPLSPRSNRLSSFPLREQVIQTIAVDALNRKWVGTKEGVFLVSFDGAQLINQFTKRNTGGALVDDDVRSIVIDNGKGIVFMGTEKGMSALWIAAVETQRDFSTLTVGPNPFLIPHAVPLTMRNLVANSFIKILRADGSLVRMFEAQGGGRAFWDGTNDTGEYVGTGVYIIVAYAENGEQVTTGKVAVIRR